MAATLTMDYSGRISRGFSPQSSLLILLNPGRVTRHCLLDMAEAARSLGIPVHTYELGPLWAMIQGGKPAEPAAYAAWLSERNVGAVLGYTCNGVTEFPFFRSADGRPVSLFEYLGIPHIMWWTDHPQWANDRVALRHDLQPVLSSPNHYHFLKSEAAAREVREVLGWRRCMGMPVAENPDRYAISTSFRSEFDIVCITGAPPALEGDLEAMLECDDPSLDEILQVIERKCVPPLRSLFRQRAPESMWMELDRLAKDWCVARRREPLSSAYELFSRLKATHPETTQWIVSHHPVYFGALEILWQFGRWQRTFYVRYLAKYFRVGVFGSDWSSVGLGPGGWVDYDDQASVYARGRLALNIPQAGDEQGVAHKPFQIAAAKIPMVHLFRRGLEDCFTPGEEVLTFESPVEARDRIRELLNDRDQCESMAAAAHGRLLRDHTWKTRLPQMLACLGEKFTLPAIGPRACARGSDLVGAH